MDLFNFKEYLSRIDPTCTYRISQLTGGLVNATVRAAKASSAQYDAGRFPGKQSIVLKYAPPYLLRRGEDAPFSQFRQVRILPMVVQVGGCRRFGDTVLISMFLNIDD